MCMIDYVDCDWKPIKEEWRQAAKPHQCDECRRQIERGERYRYEFVLSDGYPYSYRSCAQCHAASRWLVIVCNGFLCKGVLEDLEQHWEESAEYRTFWLGRAIVGMRHQWRRKPRVGKRIRSTSLLPPLSEPRIRPELLTHRRNEVTG